MPFLIRSRFTLSLSICAFNAPALNKKNREKYLMNILKLFFINANITEGFINFITTHSRMYKFIDSISKFTGRISSTLKKYLF